MHQVWEECYAEADRYACAVRGGLGVGASVWWLRALGIGEEVALAAELCAKAVSAWAWVRWIREDDPDVEQWRGPQLGNARASACATCAPTGTYLPGRRRTLSPGT